MTRSLKQYAKFGTKTMINKLTPEQESKIPYYFKKWKDIGYSSDKIIEDDIPLIKEYLAVADIHPKAVIILDSPMACQLVSNMLNISTQLDSQLYSQLYSQLISQLSSQRLNYHTLSGYGKCGNILAGYCAFYDFLISEVKPLDTDEQMRVWGLFKRFSEKFHYIFPFKDMCFVSQKPEHIIFQNDLMHHDTLPALRYPDGYELYSIRGVTIEKEIFEKLRDRTFELEDLTNMENADARAVAISMMRPELILEKENAELVHTGIKGTKLYRVPNFLDTGNVEYCMTMVCPSTGRDFLEWVEPSVGEKCDADLAQASSFVDEYGNRLSVEDYLTMQEA